MGIKLISNEEGDDAAESKMAGADEAHDDGDKEPQPAAASKVE